MRKFAFLMLILVLIAGLVPSVLAQDEEPFALTIMHTNDTHAHHDPNSAGNGGVAIQAAVVKQIRLEAPNSLLLDGGDRFTGTLYHTTYQGQDQVQLMNLLGYDAMTLGNHEFDNGDEILAEFISGLNFPVSSANVDVSGSPVLADKVSPYTVLEVGGQKVGVIGLVTADTPNISSPSDAIVFSDDYVGIVNGITAELAAEGINIIVLLTHTGIQVDLAIIEQLQGVDVFVGGHSHTLLSNQNRADYEYPLEYTSAAGEPVLYVQAGQYTEYLGRSTLEFDAAGLIVGSSGDTILLSQYITPDTEVASVMAELSEPVQALENQPIGATTEVALQGDRLYCRVEECAMGNLIADAMRWDSGAQIAIMNGGGVRASIDEGEITLGDVLTVQPFGNLLATFELKGADIITALENGVSLLVLDDAGNISRDGLAGRFPQVSGIRYSVDASAEAGSRIVSVEVEQADGTFAPLDPEATYSLVTNNFMRTGGDGYEILATNAINPYDFGRVDYEATSAYLASLGTVTAEMAAAQGRITYVTAQPAPVE